VPARHQDALLPELGHLLALKRLRLGSNITLLVLPSALRACTGLQVRQPTLQGMQGTAWMHQCCCACMFMPQPLCAARCRVLWLAGIAFMCSFAVICGAVFSWCCLQELDVGASCLRWLDVEVLLGAAASLTRLALGDTSLAEVPEGIAGLTGLQVRAGMGGLSTAHA
jgi:hypothetical protein